MLQSQKKGSPPVSLGHWPSRLLGERNAGTGGVSEQFCYSRKFQSTDSDAQSQALFLSAGASWPTQVCLWVLEAGSVGSGCLHGGVPAHRCLPPPCVLASLSSSAQKASVPRDQDHSPTASLTGDHVLRTSPVLSPARAWAWAFWGTQFCLQSTLKHALHLRSQN